MRPQPDSFPAVFECLTRLIAFQQELAKVAACLGELRIKTDRLSKEMQRLVPVALNSVGVAEVVDGQCIAWLKPHSLLELPLGIFYLAQPQENHAQVVERFRVLRLQLKCI